MTIEKIRKNAPDGATHYLDNGDISYYKKIGSFWYQVTNISNIPTGIMLAHYLKPL